MPEADLDALEDAIKERLSASGWHTLGGTTGPFLGPYIWQETDKTDYAVELPDRTEDLTVFWMDGFIMRSWLDWLSDGETGTGGWAKEEGIYCVRDAYADKSRYAEYFNVSFLKHEAQHHADLRRGITKSSELEYRAKLVELMLLPGRVLPGAPAGFRRPERRGQRARLGRREDRGGAGGSAGERGGRRWDEGTGGGGEG